MRAAGRPRAGPRASEASKIKTAPAEPALEVERAPVALSFGAMSRLLGQATSLPAPEYIVVETVGPEHDRIFRVELRIGNERVATGEGPAIKVAHEEAAREALTKLRLINST